MGSHKSRDDEAYEQGVHDGQQADFLDQVVHAQVKNYSFDQRTNEIYNKGYEYGVAHRPPKPHTEATRSISNSSDCSGYSSSPSYGGGTSSGSGDEFLGAVSAPFVLIGAVWGTITGFHEGGVLGALLGFGLGAAAGALVGVAVSAALVLGIVVLCCYAIYWLFSHVF